MSGERSLPKGWVVRESKTYLGKVYYFNMDTGASIWEHPDHITSISAQNEVKQKLDTQLDEHDMLDSKLDTNRLEENYLKRLNKKEMANSKLASKRSSCVPLAVVPPMETNQKLFLPEIHGDPRIHRCGTSNNSYENFAAFFPSNSSGSELESDDSSLEDLHFSRPKNINSNVPLHDMDLQILRTKSKKPLDYYFVLDTNVLIHLSFLKKLFYSSIGKKLVPHVYIPWICLQELQTFRQPNAKLFQVVQTLFKFIDKMVKTNNKRFHVQTFQEAQDWGKDFNLHFLKDDKILECCEFLTKKLPEAKVILITNDINLDSKARVFKIPVFSIKDLMNNLDLKQDSKVKALERRPHTSSSKIDPFPKMSKVLNVGEKKILVNRKWSAMKLSLPDNTMKRKENSQILLEAFLELKSILHPFLIATLQKIHGDSWKSLGLNISNLKGILSVIVNQWHNLFASGYSKKIQRNFILLQTTFNNTDFSQFSKTDYINTLTAIEDIFCVIKRKSPDMNVNVENIQLMRVACLEILSKDTKGNATNTLELSNVNDIDESTSDVDEDASDVDEIAPDVDESASGVAEKVLDVDENALDGEETAPGIDENVSDLEENASDIDKDASVVDENASVVDENASVVDKDASGVDEGASDVDEIASKIKGTASVEGELVSVSNKSTSEIVCQVLEYNWTIMNHLCGLICNFYSVPHDLDYDKPDVIPSDSELKGMISKLHPKLKEIKLIMEKIVSGDSCCTSLEFNKFYTALINFVPDLDIETESIDTTNFNHICLAEYCKSPINLGVLVEANKLLNIYSTKLEEVVAKVGI